MTETVDDSSGELDEKDSNTEELAIDEEYDTNWSDMPPEIKLECIGKMDIEMRSELRLTARAENQLVDSLRYKFEELVVYHDSFSAYSVREDWREYVGNIKFWLPYVLKHCDFDNIEIPNLDLLDRIDFVKLDTVLKPRVISFECAKPVDFNTIIRFFKTCWNKVKKISMSVPWRNTQLSEFFAIPSVFNAPYLRIQCNHWHTEPIYSIPLIEKWIEIDAPVNTKLEISECESLDFETIFDLFLSRMISRDELIMRIKTDNLKKHILMHYSIDMDDWQDPYFCVAVVPSDIDKSQYSEYTRVYDLE